MMDPMHNYSRGIGANGFAYNGGSDRAQQSRITFNARPNYTFIEQKAGSQKPYYPHTARDTPQHKNAHKGLLGFSILSPHVAAGGGGGGESGAVRSGDYPHSPSWGMDRDSVSYIDNLNGMLSEGDDDSLVDLLDRIRVYGFIDVDIDAEPFREAGSPLNNNLIASGTPTIPNVGMHTIRSGQTVMWDIPVVKNGKIVNCASDYVDSFEQGLAPLITVPYTPAAHKGSPALILSALQKGPEKSHNENAIARDGKVVLDSLKVIGLMYKKLIDGQDITDADLEKAKIGSYEDASTLKFRDALLNPAQNWVHDDKQPTMGDVSLYTPSKFERPRGTEGLTGVLSRSKVAGTTGGGGGGGLTSTRNGWDAEKTLNILQLRAFAELFSSVASVESQYARRVIGQAMTTADPGRDFDLLLKMSPNGSL